MENLVMERENLVLLLMLLKLMLLKGCMLIQSLVDWEPL